MFLVWFIFCNFDKTFDEEIVKSFFIDVIPGEQNNALF